ncbi:MAG: DUF4091 domain-containing protein [Clostridia bacterium]|nr:DUF4091 domain-containing protein [Clostridia bacterium]
MIEIFPVSSLERIYPDKRPKPERRGAMAKNEVYSFQVAYFFDYNLRDMTVKVEGALADFVEIRQIELVPATSPNTWKGDGYQVTDKPFLCPDVLRPLDTRALTARYNTYNGLWVTVKGNVPVGKHKVRIALMGEYGEIMATEYALEVLDFELCPQELVYTNWFHYDGIANYYNLAPFSRKYMPIMESYIKKAVEHGMNMLLVPMFTPPLDTRVGKERLTCQLVDIEVLDGKYIISLDRLIAFMKRALELGIKYFEMSHLFTQWGAKACPKIVAKVGGRTKKIFGWDNGATSKEYEEFLNVFLPTLEKRLTDEGLFDRCYFHISDEPNDKCINEYKGAKEIFKKYMPRGIVMDALSHYEFYKDGLVENPVCGTDAIDVFLENKVPNLWAYYCCAQSDKLLANRFMGFEPVRNRVIGVQLYQNNIKGFLQWGYNFYNSVLSDEPIDPYLITDAGCGLQSGDCFIVYPGRGGALDSARHEVFYDGLQDMRLLYTLENKIGRDKVLELLESHGYSGFRTYPHSYKALLELRRTVQRLIVNEI